MNQKYYNKQYFIQRDHMDMRMAEAVKTLMIKNNFKKVLDVGCGTGRFVEFLNKNGFQCFGIDNSPKAVKIANQITSNRIIKASAVELPFKNNSFDLIFSNSVIEHLTEKEVDIFLQESGRILKKGGLIFLVTPNFISPFKYIQGKKWFAYSDPTHINFYSPKRLSRVLKEHLFYEIRTNFEIKCNISFDWDLPNSIRVLPTPLRMFAIYLLFSTPISIIRNSFWMAARKK